MVAKFEFYHMVLSYVANSIKSLASTLLRIVL